MTASDDPSQRNLSHAIILMAMRMLEGRIRMIVCR